MRRKRLRIGEKVSIAVADGNAKQLPFLHEIGERGVGGFCPQVFELAQIFQADISQKGAGQQSRFGQDLKSVADTKDESAFFGEIGNGIHYRRELRQRSGSQVVTVGKSAGQKDRVKTLYGGVLVPDEFNRFSEDGLDCVITIVLAVGARKDDDAEFHTVLITPKQSGIPQ